MTTESSMSQTAGPAGNRTPAGSTPVAQPPVESQPLIRFYRPEEGHRSRAVIGFALATLLLYGSHAFYEWLPVDTWHKPLPTIGTFLGDEFAISSALLSSVLLATAVVIGVFKLVNHPKFVDFLIETEGELEKVAWASQRQVINESIVVVVTVLILMGFVFVVDGVLILFKKLPVWEPLWDKLFG